MGRWTSTIQDPRMLEIAKAEWYDTLKDFDRIIIMETISDVKKLKPEDNKFPDSNLYYAIASGKLREKKEAEKMAARKHEEAEQSLHGLRSNPEKAKAALDEIRRLCNLKRVQP